MPEQDSGRLLRSQLRQLHKDAGKPKMDVLSDRAGSRRSRSTLANVLTPRHGFRWGTVDTFVDACVGYAADHGNRLPEEMFDKAYWEKLYEAAYPPRSRTTPASAAARAETRMPTDPEELDLANEVAYVADLDVYSAFNEVQDMGDQLASQALAAMSPHVAGAVLAKFNARWAAARLDEMPPSAADAVLATMSYYAATQVRTERKARQGAKHQNDG